MTENICIVIVLTEHIVNSKKKNELISKSRHEINVILVES